MLVTGDTFSRGCAAGCMFSHNLEQKEKTFLNDTRLQPTFCILGLTQILGQIVSIRIKKLIYSKTNLVAFRYVQSERPDFRLTCVAQKRLWLGLNTSFTIAFP